MTSGSLDGLVFLESLNIVPNEFTRLFIEALSQVLLSSSIYIAGYLQWPGWEVHRELYRRWGKYDSVDNGMRYQVKRITVKPGAEFSVQMNDHRAEHWVVVSGVAQVT